MSSDIFGKITYGEQKPRRKRVDHNHTRTNRVSCVQFKDELGDVNVTKLLQRLFLSYTFTVAIFIIFTFFTKFLLCTTRTVL